MHELKLISNCEHQLKPIVAAALENELRLIEAGIRQTEQCLLKFEKQFQLQTLDFIVGYENDELEETMDFIEWIGEFRLLERLREKADTLRNIRFAN
ncbi:MAG: hypothetical protein NT166_14090 [Candidatus Aminicenantes bacterium]|nr:hypothetical protein [Candidatus Aminicenantes bacterium]